MIYNKDSGPGFNSVLRVAKLDKKKSPNWKDKQICLFFHVNKTLLKERLEHWNKPCTKC